LFSNFSIKQIYISCYNFIITTVDYIVHNRVQRSRYYDKRSILWITVFTTRRQFHHSEYTPECTAIVDKLLQELIKRASVPNASWRNHRAFIGLFINHLFARITLDNCSIVNNSRSAAMTVRKIDENVIMW